MTPVESFSFASPVFSRAWISALADRPTRDQQSHLATQDVGSCDQLLIGDATAYRCRNHAVEAIKRLPSYVAIIEPKSKLVDVAPEMLWAGVVIHPMQATLEECPNALNAVCSNAAPTVLASAVIDCLMLKKQTADIAVSGGLIGVQRRSGLDVCMYRCMQISRVRARNRFGNRAPAALAHTHHRSFADSTTPGVELFASVFVGFFAADIGLINLNNAAQYSRIIAASLAQTLEHKPSRFLSDADLLGELQRGYAFARCNQQVHGIQPFVQGHMAALKDGAGADGKILFALVTAVVATLARRDPVAEATDWATATLRPQASLQVQPRRLRIREKVEKLQGADCNFISHDFFSHLDSPRDKPRGYDCGAQLSVLAHHYRAASCKARSPRQRAIDWRQPAYVAASCGLDDWSLYGATVIIDQTITIVNPDLPKLVDDSMAVIAHTIACSNCGHRCFMGCVAFAAVVRSTYNRIFAAWCKHDVTVKHITGKIMDAAGVAHFLRDCVSGHFKLLCPRLPEAR